MKIPGWLMPATPAQFNGWFLGSMGGMLLLVIWWLFFSKLRWADRLIFLAAFILGAVTMVMLSHPSLGIFGLILHGLPISTTAWVGWLILTQKMPWPMRKTGLLAVNALVWLAFLLIRMDGTDGKIDPTFSFRWSSTTEDHFLAELASKKNSPAPAAPAALPPVPKEPESGDWPAFRGANRDGRLTGVKIASDWEQHPPKQLWRHRIGPGWSSFTVIGPRAYTQEQRGKDELVVCYDANSGAELWTHSDEARFSEVIAGPGPRATPTFFDGKIFAQGAKGKLNCLDASDGKAIWSRDIVADTKASEPMWGFSASPLIFGGLVSVFAGGPGKSVIAYNVATGEPAWSGGKGSLSYCSVQQAKIDGVDQLLITTSLGLESYDPKGGQVLWTYEWDIDKMSRVIQPAIVGGSDVLLGTGFGLGTRRIHVTHDGGQWTRSQVWMSQSIRPYYNDLVIHGEYIYGFDTDYLTCVSLADGSRKWQAKGYGNGQVLLIADQNLLLVLSEKGTAALVETNPQAHTLRGKFQAITGKTWNHPVIAHGKLFVRNGEEAACYEMAEQK